MNRDFLSLQVCHMRKILSEYLTRLGSAAPNVCSEGIWYGVDCYRACKQRNQSALLEKFGRDGIGFHGYGSEEFFDFVKDPQSPTGRRIYTFLMKKGKRASEGLSRLQRGPSLLDCGNVCFLACYQALSDLLTEEKFDCLFDPEGLFPFALTPDDASPISLLMPRERIESEEEVQRGDICYFCNCREYVAKHPAGEARGFNALACGGEPQKYLGFGLSADGLERIEIEKSLWQNFNEEPVDEPFYPADVWRHFYSQSLLCEEKKSRDLVRAFRQRTLTWEEYQKSPGRLQSKTWPMDGKMGLWVHRPNLSLIEQLAEAPRESITGILRHGGDGPRRLVGVGRVAGKGF